jgi:hypothetical protein
MSEIELFERNTASWLFLTVTLSGSLVRTLIGHSETIFIIATERRFVLSRSLTTREQESKKSDHDVGTHADAGQYDTGI